METHNFGGVGYKLGLLVPPEGHIFTTQSASSVPGFRVWTDEEINAALATKQKDWLSGKWKGKEWVTNQGRRGSCACAAAKGALRRAMFLAGMNTVPDLNHEFTYAQCNRGQDGGSVLEEVAKSIQDTGMPDVNPSKHPLNRDIFLNDYTPEDYRDAHKNRAGTVFMIENENELCTLLLSGQGAACVAVHVGNNFNNFDANGYPGAQSYGVGNHCVVVDDVFLLNNKKTYHMANSWDTTWGDEGTCNLDWDKHLANTIKYHKFFGVMSVNTDKQLEETKPLVKETQKTLEVVAKK